MTAGVTAFIWVDWMAGSGDGTATLTVGTSVIKSAGSSASLANGDESASAVEKDAADSRTHIYDQILVDDAAIGDVDA